MKLFACTVLATASVASAMMPFEAAMEHVRLTKLSRTALENLSSAFNKGASSSVFAASGKADGHRHFETLAISSGCTTAMNDVATIATGTKCKANMDEIGTLFDNSATTEASLTDWSKKWCETSGCAADLNAKIQAMGAACSSEEDKKAVRAKSFGTFDFSDLNKFKEWACTKEGSGYCLGKFFTGVKAATSSGGNFFADKTVLDKMCSPCAKKLFDLISLAGPGNDDLYDTASFIPIACLKRDGEYCTPKVFASMDTMMENDKPKFDVMCSPCFIDFFTTFVAIDQAKRTWYAADKSRCSKGVTTGEAKACEVGSDHICCVDVDGASGCDGTALKCKADSMGKINEMFAVMCAKAEDGKTHCGAKIYDAMEGGTPPEGECPDYLEMVKDGATCAAACKTMMTNVVGKLGCCAKNFFRMMGMENPGTYDQLLAFATTKCGVNLGTPCSSVKVQGTLSLANVSPSTDQATLKAALAKDIAVKSGVGASEVTVDTVTIAADGTLTASYTINPSVKSAADTKASLDSNKDSGYAAVGGIPNVKKDETAKLETKELKAEQASVFSAAPRASAPWLLVAAGALGAALLQ